VGLPTGFPRDQEAQDRVSHCGIAAVTVMTLILSACIHLIFIGASHAQTAGVTEAPVTETSPNACESGVPDLADYTKVYALNIPRAASSFAQNPVPYSVNNTSSVTWGFDKIAYCLEADAQWSYASMSAFTQDPTQIGVPVDYTRSQRVDDLTVRGSAVTPVTHSPNGAIEFGYSQYASTRSERYPGTSDTLADADDTFTNTSRQNGYGAMQVHDLDPAGAGAGATPQTVLAYNGFSAATPRVADIGIGTKTAAWGATQPDATFLTNASSFSTLRLSIYVRRTGVTTSGFPADRQLFPRASTSDLSASVSFSASVTSPRVQSLTLQTFSGEVLASTSTRPVIAGQTVSFTSSVPVGLTSSGFVLTANTATGSWVVRTAADVVAGDVIVVNGQSNAETLVYPDDNAQADADAGSPWIRTVGGAWDTTNVSLSDRGWYVAKAAGGRNSSGSIGSWELRMARDIVDAEHVPIAVVTGAHGGQPVAWFEQDYDQAGDTGNNYARLMGRLESYELVGAVRSVIYYQGETDATNSVRWTPGFTQLTDSWNASFPNLAHIYLTQIRACCGGDAYVPSLRAVEQEQFQMAKRPKLQVMSTQGLNAFDGGHFRYTAGYQDLGHWFARLFGHDSYGASGANVTAPTPVAAHQSPDGTTVTIELANSSDLVTADAGAATDFRVITTSGTVIPSAVSAQAGSITLTIPAGRTAIAVSYLGRAATGPGPWVHNAAGIGLLVFLSLPVAGQPTLDLALNKPASQSSDYTGTTPAFRAVDGNVDGADGSFSHTNADPYAWWKVDLQSSTPITSIRVYNRTDCCADRLSNYWVFVSDNPFNTNLTPAQQGAQPGIWSSHQTITPNPSVTITPPPNTTGRYLMIQQAGTQYLHLAEVTVQ